MCKPRVKPASLIIGHDFCPGNVITPWPYGVIEAYSKFCAEGPWQYHSLTVEPHAVNPCPAYSPFE
jgi:hypothetical protein